MSGLEPIALIGVAAALIQALDSSIRIVKQIRERRKAHGALPPPALLEESFETGKRAIENVLEEGRQRFGPSFVEGDMTAKLAILQITVHTQNALLERLTEAREDDGIVDFDTVLDLSDKGRNDAVLQLREYLGRRLEEEMALKSSARAQAQEISKEPVSSPVTEAPPLEQPLSPRTSSPPAKDVRKPSITPSSSSSTSTSSMPPRISWIWNSKSANKQKPSPPTPTRSSTPNSVPISTRAGCQDDSRQARSLSTSTTLTSHPPPTTKDLSTTVEIQKYAGSCKYAFAMRDKGLKAGLSLQDVGMYYSGRFIYKCKSSHCEFRGGAVRIKRNWEMDTSVRKWRGLQYRWAFLAKSHMACKEKTGPMPFLCLICTMLKKESPVFHGPEQLLSHIVSHRTDTVGDVLIEGPLSFTNAGLKIESDNFDVCFSDNPSSPTASVQDADAAARASSYEAGLGLVSEYSVVGDDPLVPEHERNPWASATICCTPRQL